MSGKRVIVNSHYSKWVIRPQECPLRVRQDGGDYCSVVKGILCGYYNFPRDCPLEDWGDEE